MMDSILSPSLSIPIGYDCCSSLLNRCFCFCCRQRAPRPDDRPGQYGSSSTLKIHCTFPLLLVVQLATSLQYVGEYPLYSLLVLVLYGPVLFLTVLVHECGHLWMSHHLSSSSGYQEGVEASGQDREDPDNDREEGPLDDSLVLWPLGGYTVHEMHAMARPARRPPAAALASDLKIALAGTLTHVPMALFWLLLHLSAHVLLHPDQDIRDAFANFTFRTYLSVLSSDTLGFLSTLFQQACLLNVLLLWFNLFLPAHPLDAARIVVAAMMRYALHCSANGKLGMTLDKIAFLTSLVSMLASLALTIWSVLSFVDGVGTTGLFSLLVALYAFSDGYRVYGRVIKGGLLDHPLFGRSCYKCGLWRYHSDPVTGHSPELHAQRRRADHGHYGRTQDVDIDRPMENDDRTWMTDGDLIDNTTFPYDE